MSGKKLLDPPPALAGLIGGQCPDLEGLHEAAPFMLDVLCGQNAEAVDRCNDAIGEALRTLAAGEVDLAVRAVKALRTMPHLPTKRVQGAPDAATADVLAAALDRFRAAGNWSAFEETMLTVSQLFDGDWPMPPNLLEAAVHAVHLHLFDVHKNTLWRYATLLARKDTSGQFLASLCRVCAVTARDMAVYVKPAKEDLVALEFLLEAMYRSQPLDRRHEVTRALVGAGMLKSATYLLRSHGLVVQGYVNLLRRVWDMAQLLDDAKFTSLVTEKDGHLQRLQDAVGWTVDVGATRERIRKLGVEWSVPASQMAANVREAEARAQAEMSATVREAVARAEKAEAEIARVNAVVRQSLGKVLDMQTKADTVHATDAVAAAAAPASAAPALVTANVAGRTARDIIYITGPGGVGKSTLAQQILGGQRGRVVEVDGGDEWAAVESVLLSTVGVLIVVSRRRPAYHFVAQCLERGHLIHVYHVVVDADAVAKAAEASVVGPPFGDQLIAHRNSDSTVCAPWVLWSVGGGPEAKCLRRERPMVGASGWY
jgi:hypothetical protein